MEPTHTTDVRTTATSAAEQRLRVDVGKRRLVRKAVKKAKRKR